MPEPPVPHDYEAERMLLGILILCPDALPEMPAELRGAWFDPDHRHLYAALEHLGTDTTIANLARAFAPNQPLEQLKAAAIISKCIWSTPSTGYAYRTNYLKDVLQLAERRRRMAEGAAMVAEAWNNQLSTAPVVKQRVERVRPMEDNSPRP